MTKPFYLRRVSGNRQHHPLADLALGVLLAAIASFTLSTRLASTTIGLTGPEFGLLLILQATLSTMLVTAIIRAVRAHGDILHPRVVAFATFYSYYVLWNPLVASDIDALATRQLDRVSAGTLAQLVQSSALVLFVAWCGLLVGLWGARSFSEGVAKWSMRVPHGNDGPVRAVALAIVFVTLGIVGNIGLIGSLEGYLAKMVQFYVRPAELDSVFDYGKTKWRIMAAFLPFGLIVGALVVSRVRQLSTRGAVVVFGAAAAANMLLSNYNGGRGNLMFVLFYSVVLINLLYRRFGVALLSTIVISLLVFALLLGYYRNAYYFGREASTRSAITDIDSLQHNVSFYLSNSIGTLVLVDEVQRSGTVSGATAFSGLKGLFGGDTPTTTELEVWLRLTGAYRGDNPRYGGPGEFYFNWGLRGVFLGMTVLGGIVALLIAFFQEWGAEPSIGSAILRAFCVISTHFVIIANLSYIPSHFILMSLPVYAGAMTLGSSKFYVGRPSLT